MRIPNKMCQENSKFLFKEMGLHNGLLPLKDMEECGYVKETGSVWLKLKKKTTTSLRRLGSWRLMHPRSQPTLSRARSRSTTRVKAKGLWVWVTLSDIYVDDPPTGKITFKTPAGLFRTFPVSAFETEE